MLMTIQDILTLVVVPQYPDLLRSGLAKARLVKGQLLTRNKPSGDTLHLKSRLLFRILLLQNSSKYRLLGCNGQGHLGYEISDVLGKEQPVMPVYVPASEKASGHLDPCPAQSQDC